MFTDEFWLLHNSLTWGINPGILELLPEKPEQISRYQECCFILKGGSERWALWVYRGREENLVHQHLLLKNYEQNQMRGFLYPLALNDGRSYARLDENRFFYITAWPDLSGVSFRNARDLVAMIRLITGFREKAPVCTPCFGRTVKGGAGRLPERFPTMIRYFDIFERLAMHRLRPTHFDRLCAPYLPEIRNQAQTALLLLHESAYKRLSNGLTIRDQIISQLSRSNLRMTANGEAVCLRFHNYRQELPIMDLMILMNKTGRAAHWSSGWFELLSREYQRSFAISPEEWGIIYACLLFPWALYRLLSRYYFNRVDWPVRLMAERLERLLDDETNRLAFLKELRWLTPFTGLE